jgi:tRNA(Arg) A34 adenosine deaminase TadA
MTEADERHLRRAIELASAARAAGDMPYGIASRRARRQCARRGAQHRPDHLGPARLICVPRVYLS